MGSNVKGTGASDQSPRKDRARRARKVFEDATRISVRAKSGRSLVDRPALIARVLDEVLRRRVVCVMADAGMGKTVLARQLACEAAEKGIETRYVSLAGDSQESALGRLMRCVKGMESRTGQGGHALVIDDVPAWDEARAHRVAQSLGSLATCDVGVVVLGRPSSASLVDELSDPVVFWSSDLTLHMGEALLWCPAWKEMSQALMNVTGGIPLLVDAVRSAVPTDDERHLPTSYGRRLGELVRACLGDRMMDEERRLRYAMLMMGHGRTSDLGMVEDRVDDCVLEDLERTCPLLGVRTDEGRYDVVGSRRGEGLRALASCNEMGEDQAAYVRARVVATLAGEGSFDRIGLICTNLLSKDRVGEVVSSWPIELANAGYPALLHKARESDEDARLTFGARVAMRVRAALARDARLSSELRQSPVGPLTGRQCEMLAQVEALEFATGVAEAPASDGERLPAGGGLAQDLVLHGRVRELARNGKFGEAYRDLLVAGTRTNTPTLSASLLCLDKELVCALVGDRVNSEEESAYEAAYGFLESRGFAGLYATVGARRAVAAVVGARALDERMLDRAQSHAMRVEDKLTEAVALIAAAAHDMRHDAHKRASVRAELAIRRAGECESDYLAVVATLLRDYATARMDRGMGGLCDFAGAAEDATPEQAAVWVLRQSLGGLSDSGRVRAALADVRAPSGLMPLCAFVIGEGGDIGSALESRMPAGWLSSARRIGCASSRKHLEEEGRLMVSSGGRMLRPATRVEAYAMGKLRLVVDGCEMCRTSWDRSAARHLFALLVCVEGHEITVKEAIEEIWPNADYAAGSRRLYPTVSSLRACLDGGDADDEESILRRSNGKLVLDTSGIYVDVDDFENEARLAVMATQTASCVRHAVAANKIYQGGLMCAGSIGGGLLRQRASKLRALYVDAMVAGAEAELRSGISRRASWFACEAVDADGLREDAVAVALRSLCAASRTSEAVRLYDAYVRRAVEAGGMGATSYIDGVMRELGVFVRRGKRTLPSTRPA